MSLVMMDGAMRVDLSRWDEAQRLGICRRCCGPIGGWGTRAPFYVVGTGIDWYHLDELDALDNTEEAEPTVIQAKRYADANANARAHRSDQHVDGPFGAHLVRAVVA